MRELWVAIVGAFLGAAAGAWAATALTAPRPPGPEAAAPPQAIEALRGEVAEIRRLLDRPGLAAAPAEGRAPAAPVGRTGEAGAGAQGATAPVDLEALATRAAQAVLEKQAATAQAEKDRQAARSSRKRLPLAEVARELALTAAQENDLRRAYEDAVNRMLKVVSEPDGDPEALRRELLAAKDNEARRAAVTMKYLPKFVQRLPDVLAIEAEREERVRAAVGPEHAKALKGYQVEESDPFGLSGNVSIGVSGN